MCAERRVTLRGQWLGQQLRELREARGLRVDEAADYLQRSQSSVSRFESAEYPIRRPDLLALLDLYGVSDGGQRATLLKLSEEVWQKGWWDGFQDAVYDHRFVDYVWLESRASQVRSFDDTLLPGLLQTRDYAAAAIAAAEPDATAERVERWAELRMTRQQVLTKDEPLQVSVVLDEALLYRMVGGSAVVREQLTHLLDCARRPDIEVRVLPLRNGAHASPTGAFKIFSMAEPYPEVAYAETPGGSAYVETPDSERFVRIYDRLCEEALGPDESAGLLSSVEEELE